MNIISELIKAVVDVGMALVVVVGLGVLLFIVGVLLALILEWFKGRRVDLLKLKTKATSAAIPFVTGVLIPGSIIYIVLKVVTWVLNVVVWCLETIIVSVGSIISHVNPWFIALMVVFVVVFFVAVKLLEKDQK